MSKVVIAFIICAVGIKYIEGNIPAKIKEVMVPAHNNCVKETGVGEEYFERARNGDFDPDPKFKCYMKCLYDQFGLVKADGTFDIEGALKALPDESRSMYEEVALKCGTVSGDDICDSAWKTAFCNYENNKENFYFL